uniref:Nucleic-acid-binding protein n=1 Tax=Schizaphis graminum TaxID=13262 RepID=A0A2S2NNM1_SCHGA
MPRNSTKRNLSATSPTQAGDNKSKLFITPNRYAALSDVSDNHHEVFSPPPVKTPSQHQCNAPPNNKEPTPGPRFFKSFSSPPFMVSGGYSHPTLVKALFDLIDPSCIYFKTSSRYLIIYTDDVDNFNLVANYLLGNQIRFHTYQPKTSKPFSVYIRYLHPSTSIDDITTGLTERGHEVIRVANILHRVTKCPLPLFRIDLKVADNNREILKSDLFLHSKVKIELPKKKLTPPQCKECQDYGHTQNYCQQTSRCVKCGENHPSSDVKSHLRSPPSALFVRGRTLRPTKDVLFTKRSWKIKIKIKNRK